MTEYTQFQPVSVGGASVSVDAPSLRDNRFVMGTRVRANLVPPRSKSRRGNQFQRGPQWLSLEAHYDTSSGAFRDFVSELRLSLADILILRGGYSYFQDEEAVPKLLGERDATGVHGFNSSIMLWLGGSKKNPGDFSMLFKYRENWARDLVRIAEFTNVPIFYFGVGLTFFGGG